MTVNAHLTGLASELVLPDTEKSNIATLLGDSNPDYEVATNIQEVLTPRAK